jgi:hypothetical protein
MARTTRVPQSKRPKSKRTSKPEVAGTEFETRFCAWLERISKKEKPPKSVVAYNIGLFESTNGYSAYLVGADEYSEEDSDWACDETFTPKERYFLLPDETKGQAWQVVLDRVARAAKDFLKTPAGKSSLFAKAKAVTVGFDDGDLTRVK